MMKSIACFRNTWKKKILYKRLLSCYRNVLVCFSAKELMKNSPDYHNIVLRMYKELENYLNVRGNSFGKNL